MNTITMPMPLLHDRTTVLAEAAGRAYAVLNGHGAPITATGTVVERSTHLEVTFTIRAQQTAEAALARGRMRALMERVA